MRPLLLALLLALPVQAKPQKPSPNAKQEARIRAVCPNCDVRLRFATAAQAKELADAMVKIAPDFPYAARGLTQIKVDPVGPSAWSVGRGYGTWRIEIQAGHLRDSAFRPAETATHEYGHCIEYALRAMGHGDQIDAFFRKRFPDYNPAHGHDAYEAWADAIMVAYQRPKTAGPWSHAVLAFIHELTDPPKSEVPDLDHEAELASRGLPWPPRMPS